VITCYLAGEEVLTRLVMVRWSPKDSRWYSTRLRERLLSAHYFIIESWPAHFRTCLLFRRTCLLSPCMCNLQNYIIFWSEAQWRPTEFAQKTQSGMLFFIELLWFIGYYSVISWIRWHHYFLLKQPRLLSEIIQFN